MRQETKRENTKRGQNLRSINQNFFSAMNYELAGEIGAIDNEDMLNNNKLITSKTSIRKRKK